MELQCRHRHRRRRDSGRGQQRGARHGGGRGRVIEHRFDSIEHTRSGERRDHGAGPFERDPGDRPRHQAPIARLLRGVLIGPALHGEADVPFDSSEKRNRTRAEIPDDEVAMMPVPEEAGTSRIVEPQKRPVTSWGIEPTSVSGTRIRCLRASLAAFSMAGGT